MQRLAVGLRRHSGFWRWAVLTCLLPVAGCQDERSGSPDGPVADSAVEPSGDEPAPAGSDDAAGSKRRVTRTSHQIEPDTNLATERAKQKCKDLCEQTDPQYDGWDTEVVSNAIEKQFKAIGDAIKASVEAPGEPLTQALPLATADYQSGTLRPRASQPSGRSRASRCFAPRPGQAEPPRRSPWRRRTGVRRGSRTLCETWPAASARPATCG